MTSIPGNILSLSLSSDLLMRDNLFEIITSSRTFYVQVKSSSRPREDGDFPSLWRVYLQACLSLCFLFYFVRNFSAVNLGPR